MEFSRYKNRWVNCGLIIIIYCAIKPLYFFDSGHMQVCDYFLVIASAILLSKKNFRIVFPQERKKILLVLLYFVGYQMLINMIWFVFGVSDIRFIYSTMYFFFNYWAFYTVILVESDIGTERTIKSLVIGSFISVVIAILGACLDNGVNMRKMGWFNNPNQLGYFAILIVTVAVIFKEHLKKIELLFMIGASVYLITISASKAAFLALIMMVIICVIFGNNTWDVKHMAYTMLLFISLFIAGYLFFYSDNIHIVSNQTLMFMRERILHLNLEADSNLGEGRGYNRIFEIGMHFFWGMGEGAYNRFHSMTGNEVHSTFINIFISYGLIGFFIISNFFWMIVKKEGKTIRNLCCLSGLVLYSFTHNGIRNTLLWILLAVIFISSWPMKENKIM